MEQQDRSGRGGRLGHLVAWTLAAVLTGPWAFGAETSPAAAPGGARLKGDGSALGRAVVAAIEGDRRLVEPQSLVLQITAAGSLVTLTGSAGTIFDREQAARLAEGVQGVSGIRPSITIKPAAAVDAAALGEAVVKMVRDANVAGPDFKADADADGTVQLSGSVTHEWTAVDAVKMVPGETAIGGYEARRPSAVPPEATATLAITTPSPEQDAVIAGRVTEALKAAGLDYIGSAVTKGVVGLSGSARNVRDVLAAYETARLVPGILGIEMAKLTVPGRAYRVGDSRDPRSIQSDVHGRLRQLAARGPSHRIEQLEVHVQDGSVLISGRAASADAAFAAVDAIAGVAGVKEVIDALSFPAYGQGT